MTTYALDIDGSGAQAGAERIVRSFNDIKAAADRMEGGVVAAAQKASAAFGRLQSAAKPVSDAAISSLKALSSALGSFRAPSEAAVRNALTFLQGLKAVGSLNLGRVSGLASLLSAISGYKGPSASAGKNTEALLKALGRASGFSASRGLAATLTALGNFRGPSAAGARNVQALLASLAAFRAPRGLAGVAAALDRITTSAMRASGALRSVGSSKVSVGGFNVITKEATKAGGAITNFAKQHNFAQTAILRTQTAMNALGGVFAARTIINASNDIIKIKAQLEAATGSIQQARVQFNFLKDTTQRLGLEFVSTARSFGFFLGSIKGTGVTFEEARQIFTGFSTAARALQLSVSDVDGIFRALGQIMSKGKLQAEELRGQLGDRLPGAFVRFAAALDMTKPGELDKALKDGAISGDRLKKAIIEVSQSLEVEFAGAADKMSKTVDASFNRLKNAFTFAAADAGANGLNAAIISLTDSLTKLVQSETVGSFMKTIAGLFMILGKNIEIVAFILGTLMVNATLKWVAGLGFLQKAMAATNVLMMTGSLTAVRMSMGLGSVAVASSRAVGALNLLKAAMLSNPIFWIAAVIMGVIYAYNKLTDTMTEQKSAMTALNGKMADAENHTDMYIAKLMNLEGQLGNTAVAVRNLIRDMQMLALEGSTQAIEGYQPRYSLSGLVTGKASGMQGPEGPISAKDQALLNRVMRRQGNGYVLRNISGGNMTPDRAGFEQLNAAKAVLQIRAQGANGEAFKPALEAVRGRWNSLVGLSRGKDWKGPKYSEWAGEVGDYNKEGGAKATLTGDPLEKAAKKKKGEKSEAEKWADELERNLERARESLGDFTIDAENSFKLMEGYLSGSLDAVSAAALGAAQGQLKMFEDSFEGAEKKAKGVMALAAELQRGGKIAADADVSSYGKSKEAILGYYSAIQKTVEMRKRESEVAADVSKMEESNRVQEEVVTVLEDRSRIQAEVNRTREIETALLGIQPGLQKIVIDGVEREVNVYELLAKALGKAIAKREELSIAEEAATMERDLDTQKRIDSALRPYMKDGASQEDIDYYRELIELRDKYEQQGANSKEIQRIINTRAELLNNARAMKKVNDELELSRQYAQDVADALTGAFKQAIESGGDFLKSFKNLFKELKSIVMDYVLYNPLKQFLRDALTGGKVAAVGTPQQGTQSIYSPNAVAGVSGLQAMIGAAVNMGQSVGRNGNFTYDNNGYLVPRGGISETGAIPGGSVDGGEQVITGARRTRPTDAASIPAPTEQARGLDFFKKIEKIFDYKANGGAIKDLAGAIRSGKVTAGSISGAIGAVGNAYAAYQMGSAVGSGVAKVLGGGFRTQAVAGGIMGGAAAGYSVGGPIGAAIGAVIGGVMGVLKKKPKKPSFYGSVTVDEEGYAVGGKGKSKGKGATDAMGKASAAAGASLFNTFAKSMDAYLTPGKYGTFGSRVFGKDTEATAFYSLTGKMKKGKPQGEKGVDWVKGPESFVQSWALIQQVRKGMITGLSQTLQTVFANTKAKDMESLNADIQAGKSYDEFVKGSFRLNEAQRQMMSLNQAFKELSRSAKELGLDEAKLGRARARLIKQMKEEFDFGISQGILEITNPAQAAFNALVAEYKSTVATAMTVGGDLVAVEKYYGLKREEMLKQFADSATNGLVSAAKNLLYELTSTQSSPLNQTAIFNNARDAYSGLKGELAAGNYANVGQLGTYTQNYLDSARQMFGSSSSYFDIFQQVTDFLTQMSALTGGTGGTGGITTPSLPSLDDVVAEIAEQNQEMIAEMGLVGTAVVEGSSQIVDAINNLAIALGYTPAGVVAVTPTPTVTAPVGTSPTLTTTQPTSSYSDRLANITRAIF